MSPNQMHQPDDSASGTAQDGVRPSRSSNGGDVALVLTGGGARAAYQVGFLKCLAQNMPNAALPILNLEPAPVR